MHFPQAQRAKTVTHWPTSKNESHNHALWYKYLDYSKHILHMKTQENLIQGWCTYYVTSPFWLQRLSSANILPVRMWWWYRPSGGHILFTIGEMKPFHFHLGGLQRKTHEKEYHLCIHKSLITSYKHLSQIFALLPIVPIKRRNIFQVKKVRL